MNMRYLSNFLPLLFLSLAVTSDQDLQAQGIFRCPIEENSGNHFSEVFLITRVPYHINNVGSLVDYKCSVYKSDIGITATHFELVPAGRQYISAPIARVVAAASGQIVDKFDTYDDLTCAGSSSTGNYIKIQHANGMITKYFFLRKNSLTNKSIGEYVNEGEFLGYPGNQSSLYGYNSAQYGGFAFEVRNSNNAFIDPFDMSDSLCYFHQRLSLWKNPAYMDAKVWTSRMLAINLETTYTTDSCGAPEDKFNRHFNYGDQIDLTVKLANANDSLLINIFNPLGVPITATMGKNYQFTTISDRTGFIQFNIPLTGAVIIPGTYTIDCLWYDSYNGFQTIEQTMQQYFTVGCVPDYTLTGTVNDQRGCLAGNNIYSTEVCNSGSRVNYAAGNEIILNPGFRAFNGSDVFIFVDPCVVTPRLEMPDADMNEAPTLTIYPNPASDFITIRTTGSSASNITIYNSTLQVLKILTIGNAMENKISVEDLPSGIYFLEAQTENGTTQSKFIINR